jgi:hypothetical protein
MSTGRGTGWRAEVAESSRNPLGEARNGLTGYRIQYKRHGIERVVRPIGVMGVMSKRLLCTKKLAISPGAAHLPGRACATTLACGAAVPSSWQFERRNNGEIEIDSYTVRNGHVL